MYKCNSNNNIYTLCYITIIKPYINHSFNQSINYLKSIAILARPL